MAKRTDIKKVLVIGSGPIVIGQAAEFDYAGNQACRVLKQAGVNVVRVNFSHGKSEEHVRTIQNVRELAGQMRFDV